jgi:beta-glucosidase/6-phospho-beta-glucosidase/beta-galactosidase
MDNFEWNHGMGLRFGLYAVDPADPAKARVARPSVATYAAIAGAKQIPDAFIARHPDAEADAAK